jgi:transposase
MAYDKKFREKVLEYIEKGNTIEKAHEVFSVGTTTIKEWKKLKKETGKLENRPLKRTNRKICPERLIAYINENPDSYLSEIAEVFNCTDPAVFYALKRLKFTRKKTISYVDKSDDLRSKFQETIDSYPQYKLYYIDECGLNQYLYREHAYSPIGVPVMGKISGKKFKRTNIVAAKCGDKVVAPMAYDGTTDSVLFECWFEEMLLKTVPRYSVLVMDNATFHRKSRLRELAEKADCDVLFLPPYSPDLNPIEKFWARLKKRLRKILPEHDNFNNALMDCF